ncbi:MAG: hypothetical protein HFG75_14680 [Hungatella sp.]|nr:hypothetical protein [Hungatella sp.]
MKKKKTAAILLLGMAAVLGTCGIFYKMFRKKESAVVSAREGDVTRYEWMEMLCEQTGLMAMKTVGNGNWRPALTWRRRSQRRLISVWP